MREPPTTGGKLYTYRVNLGVSRHALAGTLGLGKGGERRIRRVEGGREVLSASQLQSWLWAIRHAAVAWKKRARQVRMLDGTTLDQSLPTVVEPPGVPIPNEQSDPAVWLAYIRRR